MRDQRWSPGCCPDLRFWGTRIFHCTACHHTFKGITAFDAHKPGTCCHPTVCGLILREHVWHWPANDSLIRFLAKV